MKIPASSIKKIAVFRALQLGDMLCSIPAIRALKNAFPQAEITLLGLPWAKSLVDRFPNYIDRFIHFPGYPGLPEQPVDLTKFAAFLQQVQSEKFDLVLQMQGNGTIVNNMVALFGGKHIAGFYLKDHFAPNHELFIEYPDGIHEIKRHLKLINHLGITDTNTDLEFPLYDQDYNDFEQIELGLIKKKYVCIHAGSRGMARRWDPKYFAALGNHCFDQGLQVVLTGTQDEMDLVNAVKNHLKQEPIIAAGKTSLGAVGVMLEEAFALISNCTGVSHIAAALKTPSVVISLDGEPERWAPLNKDLHRTIDWTKTPDFELVLEQLKWLTNNVPMETNEVALKESM